MAFKKISDRPSAIWTVAIGVSAYFLFSRLSFTPVPWPDGSAFYLPALQWLKSPFEYRMHAQAAFVPSYDQANFNTMPAMLLVLGIPAKFFGLNMILGAPLAIRAISLIPFVGFAVVLWNWVREKNLVLAWILALGALWDPVLRWGTLVVRTETWVAFFGLLLLRDLSREPRESTTKSLEWKLALWLALAAYFHFEAIILVPIAVVGLYESPLRAWLMRLWNVGWRTGLLLAPWFFYVLIHFDLFRVQMDVQFHRLEHANYFLQNAYLFFHSLFLSHGNAEDWPKFLNLGKAIYWLLLLALLGNWILRLVRGPRNRDAITLSAAAAGVFAALWLWYTKQEIWFTTPCHTAIWTLAAASVMTERPRGRFVTALGGIAGAFALIALLATVVQQRRIPPSFNWQTYGDWVSCLERSILKTPAGARAKVWQPHVPDVLVELSERRPDLDLTRALDFPNKLALAWDYSRRADVILYSRYLLPPLREPLELYDGPERGGDRAKLDDPMGMPFGPEAIHHLPEEQPGQFEMHVCQEGPFWADLAVRVVPRK